MIWCPCGQRHETLAEAVSHTQPGESVFVGPAVTRKEADMTLAHAIEAWNRRDSSGLDVYEATHPGINVGPDTDAYRWAASQVMAFLADVQEQKRFASPTELMLLAEGIERGPAGALGKTR